MFNNTDKKLNRTISMNRYALHLLVMNVAYTNSKIPNQWRIKRNLART